MSIWSPTKYKSKNWSSYIIALQQRGSLTIWFGAEMERPARATGKRPRQRAFSDAALEVSHNEGAAGPAKQIAPGQEIATRTADGAYDTHRCHCDGV